MEVKNGSTCEVFERIVGGYECTDCLFNNNNYNPSEGCQFCVHPSKEKPNED